MSKTQAETVIKNIIREIVQECTSHGQVVSETLVAFTVKAIVLDPDNQFHVDRQLTKDDVQKLINVSAPSPVPVCVLLVADKNSLCVCSCAWSGCWTCAHRRWTRSRCRCTST